MKVFLNPGHSDEEPGAIGYIGTYEADICLYVGKLIQEILEDNGHQVGVLQHDSLAYICLASNQAQPDIFVSIHANAFERSSANGAECYYYSSSKSGKLLAGSIQRQLICQLPLTDRGIKSAGFYVLANTLAPACLVELAFLTNPRDEWLLRTRGIDFAYAVATGIMNFQEE